MSRGFGIRMLETGAILSAMLAFQAAPAGGAPEFPSADALDRLVEKAMAGGMSPGLAVAVVQGDAVRWERGFGKADLESGREVTPETAFYIASTSKALTALAAARLADRGELDLDAPVTRVLPGARFGEGIAAESIRVRDLLTHTHGIDPMGPVSLRVAYTGEYTNADLLELLGTHRPAKGGRSFQYSNLGYDLVGIILSPSTTRGWKEVVDAEVLRPLGMKATTAYRSRVPQGSVALPYEMGKGGIERIPLAKEDANMGPAGGHFSTAHDLARLLIAELNRGEIDGKAALPASVIAETQRRQVAQDGDFAFYHRDGWGLGWDLGTYEGDALIHRFGSFAGYRSHVSFMPDRRLGVVVLTNGGAISSALADVVATAIYDRIIRPDQGEARLEDRLAQLVTDREGALVGLAKDLEKRAARSQTLPRPMADYAGTYFNAAMGTLQLRMAEGRLEAQMGVARCPVEVFDAGKHQLRVELFGRGQVATVRFADGETGASAVEMMEMTFARK